MPADNAAGPGDNGATAANASNGATTPAEQQSHARAGEQQGQNPETRAPERAASRFSEVSRLLDLPADVAQQIKDQSGKPAAATPALNPDPNLNPSGELPNEQPDGEDQEQNQEQEHDEASVQQSPFKDPRVQQRIGKEVRKRYWLEMALAELGLGEAEIAAIKASPNPAEVIAGFKEQGGRQSQTAATVPQAPCGRGMLGQVADEATLDQLVTEAEVALEWCDANADGATVKDANGAERFVAPEEVLKYRRQSERLVMAAPDRRLQIRDALGAQTAQLRHYNAAAQERYPWLFDAKTPEYAEAQTLMHNAPAVQQVLRDVPGFQTHPARNLVLGYLIEGLKASAINSNPDLPESLTRKHPPIAPATAGPPSRSPALTGRTKRVAEAMQEVITDGGSRESLIAAVRAKREAGGFETNGSRRLAAV